MEFGLTNTKIVNLFLGEGERVTMSFFDQLLDRLMNGLNFGLLLALASIGVSLIYGTTGLSNFAHGEMLTFGAIVALVLGVWLGLADVARASARGRPRRRAGLDPRRRTVETSAKTRASASSRS